ncbi:uncharacterized protein LOC134256583 [Saccostrea cucullata]|uniref:uncharacterized protein LOC134256583 n=1 Tax=Saccostrea cuccullata TaxID=36930 RepID=UPI002ED17C55
MAIRSKMLSIVLIIGVELRGSAAAVTTNDLLRNNISDLHFKLFTSIQKQNRMLKSAVFETECSGRGCTFSGCQSSQSSSCDGKMLSTLRQIEISVKQLTGKDRNKGTCKNGWKRFRGHCYREFAQKQDWF